MGASGVCRTDVLWRSAAWIAALFVSALPRFGQPLTASGAERLAKRGVRQRESVAIAGHKPATVGNKITAPKQSRHVFPKYPTFPPHTVVGSGGWAGEALIGADGKIVRVWTIREVTIKPPLPAFNKAIVDAVQQWKFEPLRVDGVAMPVCMAVAIAIDWNVADPVARMPRLGIQRSGIQRSGIRGSGMRDQGSEVCGSRTLGATSPRARMLI